MYGSDKQINWANDIVSRANKYKDYAKALEANLDEDLVNVLNKVYKRVDFINKEEDAGALINWYGYLGLEAVAGRRKNKESFRKFLIDILDAEDIIYIDRIVETANLKQSA
jgi:hypothetical protein